MICFNLIWPFTKYYAPSKTKFVLFAGWFSVNFAYLYVVELNYYNPWFFVKYHLNKVHLMMDSVFGGHIMLASYCELGIVFYLMIPIFLVS